MSKSTAMKLIGLLVGAAGIALTAYKTGDWKAAVVAGVTALVTGIAGLNHPTPAAVAAFGESAK